MSNHTPAPRDASGKLTPEYISWVHMRGRCNRPSAHNYRYYGGRGIRVCERWDEFSNFFADMGPRPSVKHTLDRIEVNGNYEPTNCRWATQITQVRNSRHNHLLTANGITRCLSEWAEVCGVGAPTIRYRLCHGQTPEQALRPIQKGR